MFKRLITIFILVIMIPFLLMAQSKKFEIKKSKKAEIERTQDDSFYLDYKNRQAQANARLEKVADTGTDMIFASWDWPANSYMPDMLGMYELFGDGVLYPVAVATDNTLQRAAWFGYIDDLGAGSYPVYGYDGTTPFRTGWNSHIMMDEANGKAYVVLYDFLNASGNINNHIMEIDLATDYTVATQITSPDNEYGWPRGALTVDGNFIMAADNADVQYLDHYVSTDGGATFTYFNSTGDGDPTFYYSGDTGNDPAYASNGTKISFITTVTRDGAVSDLGIFGATVSTTDSADGTYHWYSTDAGATWQGEWIQYEGTAPVVNRPNHEVRLVSFDVANSDVDGSGVTHHIRQGGPNSAGIIGADTINVTPIYYWNDNHRDWLSLEEERFENYTGYNDAFFIGNMNGSGRPVVKASDDGEIVVAMWTRPQFRDPVTLDATTTYAGDGGASSTEVYNYDIVYAYSDDFGATWSTPEYAVRDLDVAYYWPNIGKVVNNGDGTAEVHFLYFYDDVPGSSIVGAQNDASPNSVWRYDMVELSGLVVSVDDDTDLVANGFSLEQNYPNPFNPSTTIKFSVPETGMVTLKVYDVLGKEVATLMNEVVNSGQHTVDFNAENLTSGIYFYEITNGDLVKSNKMMLLK